MGLHMRITYCIALLSLFAGCSSINTSGLKASSDYENDMTSVYIIVDDSIGQNNDIWKDNPDIAASAESILKKIGAQSEVQWPKKFAAQGIRAEVARTSHQKQLSNFSIVLIAPPQSTLDYDMMIKLESITPLWFGMFNVNYKISLRDRKNRSGETLWKGNIELHKGLLPINELGLANEMADSLLSQMKEHGVAK